MSTQTKEQKKAERREKWRSLGRILVGKGLPAVGGALGGPLGASIGSGLAEAIGVDDDPDDVGAAITADPKAMIELARIEADLTAAEQETVRNEHDNITRRWESDNQSASVLTRNIRPAALAFLLLVYAAFIFSALYAADQEAAETALEFGSQLRNILITVVVAYFGSRGTEKITECIRCNPISEDQRRSAVHLH